MHNWTIIHGGLVALVARASQAVQDDFEKQERSAPYTSESALAALELAYIQWNAQGAVRGKFNTSWLEKNGSGGLYQWAIRNGGLDALVARASREVRMNFSFLRKTF